MFRISRLAGVLACASAAVLGSAAMAAGAQDYPARTIRMIVPFPPGGTVDIVGRTVAHEMSKRLGVSIVVENKGGAGGTIGANEVAKAAPDGYTLLIAATHHSINPSLRKDLPYDSLTELSAIGRVITTPSVLVVGAGTPYRTLDDLIRQGRKKNNGLNFGSTGMGGVNHLTAELFKAMASVDMVHIPYKGAAPAMTDLLGGQIPIMFDSPPTVVEHVRTGRIRALAVSGSTRSPMLPEVPTFQEAGIAGFEAQGWVGVMGPGGLPSGIRAKLSEALLDYLRTDQARTRFAELGIEVAPLSYQEFDRYFRGEVAKWKRVIEGAGISIE